MGKELALATEQEAGWASKPVRTVRRTEESCVNAGIRTSDSAIAETITAQDTVVFEMQEFCSSLWYIM